MKDGAEFSTKFYLIHSTHTVKKYKKLKRKFSLESSDWQFMGFDHLAMSMHELLFGNFSETYSTRELLLCKKPDVLSHSHFAHWKKTHLQEIRSNKIIAVVFNSDIFKLSGQF